MTSSLGFSQPLRSLVTNKFQQAKQAKEVIFSDTQLTLLQTAEIGTFQLRYLPNLAKKPTDNISKAIDSTRAEPGEPFKPTKPKIDPFANPSQALLVVRIPAGKPSHNLVLNKFPVIPNHFILATQENKPQDFPLEVDDISLTHECIKAWQDDQSAISDAKFGTNTCRALFAFFNSGMHSGASQPHRHVQFLPVEDMNAGTNNPWSVLVNGMNTRYQAQLDLLHNPSLPFIHYAIDVQPHMTADDLHAAYIFLLRAVRSTILSDGKNLSRQSIEQCSITYSTQDDSDETVSRQAIPRATETLDSKVIFDYNLCMTMDKMAIIPRSHGEVKISSTDTEEDRISVNGTILAGTLMTKSEKQWHLLREQPELLVTVLGQIGYPKPIKADDDNNNIEHRL